MCVIIDINSFHLVFDTSTSDHAEFAPVRDWIVSGTGKIVYGGNTYKLELRKASKYLRLLSILNRSNKIITVSDNEVNAHETRVKEIEPHSDFDDPHLVAIAYVSKCEIICSRDKTAYKFLVDKRFYPKNSPRPKIYSSKQNTNLLKEKYMAKICLPCIRLNKTEQMIFK